MKNENVVKINNLGKVSRILIIIAMIINMIAIVCLPILCIVLLMLPDNSIIITGSASARIIIDDEDLPKYAIRIDEQDFDGKIFGTALKWIVTDEGTVDGKHEISINGGINDLTGKQLKSLALVLAACGEVILICLYIALVFAQKLARALEECNSPFEEEVLRRMKVFGIALAVWACAVVLINGISGIFAAFVVIVVLLFISVFKYGAQLQQQADDTV